jgi:enamine deaminase RidA (YjgF/YER057c/UK114 family)
LSKKSYRHIHGAALCIAALLLGACQNLAPQASNAEISHLNPPTMIDPAAMGYSQVVMANGGKLIFIAGQGPTNPNGKAAGKDDLRGQTRQAVDNILAALEAAGAGPENILYLRINVVGYNPRMMMQIAPELKRLKGENTPPPASVFVGVEALILPSTLIEIETIAAL